MGLQGQRSQHVDSRMRGDLELSYPNLSEKEATESLLQSHHTVRETHPIQEGNGGHSLQPVYVHFN